MPLWQETMIKLARNERMAVKMQGSRLAAKAASLFIGGPDLSGARQTAGRLKARGFFTSLYYLGEYVQSPELVAENMRQIVAVAETLEQSDSRVEILSVDLTQVGSSPVEDIAEQNVLRIGGIITARTGRNLLMLDMEDLSCVQKTIDLYYKLLQEKVPAAITIQAYLRRSEADIRRLVAEGATIRLVKGAFSESRKYAWTSRAEIRGNYVRLARLMLSSGARTNGVHPIFGTHDQGMISAVTGIAGENGWPADAFEFEMLYGVKPGLQRRFLEEGAHVRLYVPFGTQWWPYTIRRVGERPSNLWFVLRAILGRPGVIFQ